MKPISSIIIIIVAASITLAIDPEEKKAQMMKVFMECKSTTNANDDDIAKMMMHAKPSTHEGKCMFSCVMEKMGIIVDGKLNQPNMIAWAESMGAKTSVVDTVMAECGGLSDPDPCEAATILGLCFKTVSKKSGIDMDM
ncbi:general odorant-binding protein 28a-like [Chironomus tepperi]|uniref:general odorant-binding protein 28a-like n=1 Tax=Chironomus tepperi TaxID=113505 RepID=UPI00391F1033